MDKIYLSFLKSVYKQHSIIAVLGSNILPLLFKAFMAMWFLCEIWVVWGNTGQTPIHNKATANFLRATN